MARRQTSVSNRHSKKTKVSGSAAGSPQPPPPPPLVDDKETKAASAANGTKKGSRSKRKLKSEELAKPAAGAEPVAAAAEAEQAAAMNLPGKVPIPRLISLNRSSPVRLPAHSKSPSPTIAGKPKFVAIQPKPSNNAIPEQGLSSLSSYSLPQLKEEDSNSRPPNDLLEGVWTEGAAYHDDELANYWSVSHQHGEPITENSLSPKPAQQAHTELSQLRVLLEQNEGKSFRIFCGLNFMTPLYDVCSFFFSSQEEARFDASSSGIAGATQCSL